MMRMVLPSNLRRGCGPVGGVADASSSSLAASSSLAPELLLVAPLAAVGLARPGVSGGSNVSSLLVLVMLLVEERMMIRLVLCCW